MPPNSLQIRSEGVMWKTQAEFPTPAVVVDLDVVEKNLKTMHDNAAANGLEHRPHIKTHRCIELAKMQMAAGSVGITCAKLAEAEVMVEAGLDNIFLAYPLIGKEKVERLLALYGKCRVLRTEVNSYVGAKGISDEFEAAGKVCDVLIEIDGGLNRGGVKLGKPTLEFAESIRNLKGIHICGLMYYGGLIYHVGESMEKIREYTKKEHDDLVETGKLLEQAGFDMQVLSAGSSFSGKHPDLLRGITEIRSGNYIFNDGSALEVGLATPEECALRVIATVASRPDDHTVILDVGSKTLTTDRCNYGKNFGYLVEYPELELYSLNEEHGFVRSQGVMPLQIGDRVSIIPNHACVVPNVAGELFAVRHGEFVKMLHVDARGKSY